MYKRQDQYITDNRWKLWKTPYYKSLNNPGSIKRFTIIEQTEEYLRVWKKSVDKLFTFLNEKLPECHVIIHKARNVSVLNDKGTLVDLAASGRVKRENVDLLNQYWDELNQYVIDHYPVSVIEVNDKPYYTYIEHPWGPFYVHYSEDYYHKFLLKLHQNVFSNYVQDYMGNKILLDIFKQYDDLSKRNEQLNQELLDEKKLSMVLQEKIKLDEKEYQEQLKSYENESIITYLKKWVKLRWI